VSNIPLAERHLWVGASEAAALFGVSPYTTYYDLWLQKAGRLPAEDLDDAERIQAGRFLEPAIAAWANERWGMNLTKVTYYLRHLSVPQMGASLDFGDAGTGVSAEIKNVDRDVFRDEWAAERDIITDAPIHILIQKQHQFACDPLIPYGWIIACVGGNRLLRMRVERHEATIAALEESVAEFWASVRSGVAPTPDWGRDRRTLDRLYAITNGRYLDLRGNARVRQLCDQYLMHKGHEKAHKAQAGAARAELLSLIGEAETVQADGFRIKASTQQQDGEPYRVIRITKER